MAKTKKTKASKSNNAYAARRSWTKDDVRTLKTMAKAKAGVTKISKSLRRTPAATTVKAAQLGVSLSMR